MKGVTLRGRVLYLTRDPEFVRRQLAGEDVDWNANDPAHALRDEISTDEMTPGWVCYHSDETLGRFVYLGLTCDGEKPVGEDAVRRGGFVASVSGRRRGKGSSREAAPFAEKAAGIRLVVGESLERIYRQNAVNLGLLVTDDFSVLESVARGEAIPISVFLEGQDAITRDVIRLGGLFPYQRARLSGTVVAPPVTTPARPMTLAEKILARHFVVDAATDVVGVPAVAPGDAGFVRCDLRFSHEYVTPMAATFFENELGGDARVAASERVLAFRDHLKLLPAVMPEEQRRRGLLEIAEALATRQAAFCAVHGIRLREDGICHSVVTEHHALPGQVVVGSDSHTPHAGALGCFAFGVGTTELACSWLTRDVRLAVPATVRVEIEGRLDAGVTAKDLMLALLAHPYVKGGGAIGKVLEYAGACVEGLSIDERATLTNMSAEAGAFTGIVAPDETTARFLSERRGLAIDEARTHGDGLVSDPDAAYETVLHLDATALAPRVALPGDPGNGVAIDDLVEPVLIDIAYGGSCTAGKRSDLEMYATVLADGLAQGRRVAPGVRFFIQAGSADALEWARARGYLELFERAGATLLAPGCGACIAAGPGVSTNASEVTVSAINRNFPGRSGPGKVYLASPYVVAASALAGRLTSFRPG
ncbi:MAG: 3-isopropylmalate dehydratase [Acidobacteria bacterium]|nr:3-isopropylmalate dehydratase [Acidobacteriota bacterium]